MQCVALALILELRGRWADRSWTQLLWSALSLCAYPTDPSPPLNITHYPRHKHTRTPDNLTTSLLPSPSNLLFLTIMCFAAIVHSTSRGHIAVSLSVHCCMSCQWCVYIYIWLCALSIMGEIHVCVHIRPPEGCRLLRGERSCLWYGSLDPYNSIVPRFNRTVFCK